MSLKKTQGLTREEMQNLLAVARGDKEPSLLIKNVELLDLVNGGTTITHVAIWDRWIAGIGLDYEGKNILEGKGLTIVPGFIDGHVHLESSLMHPFEFEKLTLPLGTTTLICDPHEITNVLGERGFSWFLRSSELMQQNLFVQVSSCIPSLPGFETQGGKFDLAEMKAVQGHPHVIGLAEMMNYPGVVKGDKEVLDKLEAFAGMNLDGHCPLVKGKVLNAYLAAGIQNCHETVTLEEGKEKLLKGMSLILREGSVAKNLNHLAPLINEFNSQQCFLCTDDRNPYEIFHEGHINYLVWKLIHENGIPPHVAYRLSSFSAAKHFGLRRLGLIAPGYQADFILLKNLRDVQIESVYIKGKAVKDLNLPSQIQQKLQISRPPMENTIQRKFLSAKDLSYDLLPGTYNVIGIIPDEIITKHLKVKFDGKSFAEKDILKISVIERYGHQLSPALGLVTGMGPINGALASSVAHDSHNLIVIGSNEEDMVLAVNTLIESGGGFCVVNEKKVQGLLPLPLAGLISCETAENISASIEHLRKEMTKMKIGLSEPFLQMAFLALPVIPSLKLTDKGPIDVHRFKLIPLRDDENK